MSKIKPKNKQIMALVKSKIEIETKNEKKNKEMEVEECPICSDKYTKIYRKKYSCTQCNQDCCLRCFQTYLMDNPMQCMYPDCHKSLDPVEIRKIVTNNAFCKRLDESIARKILEEEKTRLPFYQPIAQVKINQEKYKKRNRERLSKILELENEIYSLEYNLETMYTNLKDIISINRGENNKEFNLEKESFLEQFYQTKQNISDLYLQKYSIKIEDEMDRVSVGFVKKERKEYTFIKQCAHENCNGFLERTWMCSICEKYTCSKCHEPKEKRHDENHVCNPDTIANVEALKKDSKPCPKCGTGIFKIDGCNAMFCILCQTSFDWVSGKLLSGNVHNPEALRWQREQGIRLRSIPVEQQECIEPLSDEFNNWIWFS